MKKFLSILALAFFVVSCDTADVDTTAKEETNTVVEATNEVDTPAEKEAAGSGETAYDDESISFTYPSEWTMQEEQGILMIMTPTDENDAFQENINFLSQEYKNFGIDFDAFVKANVENIDAMLESNNGEVVSPASDVTVNGIKGKKLQYKFDMYDVTALTTQYYFDKNGRGYIVTVTESPETAGDFKSGFDTILNSYQIK